MSSSAAAGAATSRRRVISPEIQKRLAKAASSSSSSPSLKPPPPSDDQSYHYLLRELAVLLNEKGMSDLESMKQAAAAAAAGQHQQPPQLKKLKKIEVSAEAERLLRDAAAVLSDTRPPPDFVVYPDGTFSTEGRRATDLSSATMRPPIFDGGVANATPPPLGGPGAGASGGAGTILHLACALDVPLVLAFLLAMGADARATHTAFRRLLIHESACNGSINCLTLLLELGQRHGDNDKVAAVAPSSRGGLEFDLPFLPRRIDRAEAIAPLQLYVKHSGLFGRKLAPAAAAAAEKVEDGKDFLSILRLFRESVANVRNGTMSELDAARKVMEHVTLTDPVQRSLSRSCGFLAETPIPRNFVRPHGGSSDGHGNTPLHWAAFKNEIECVSLLLKYKADPNARAHPSGWTPLHDAAYSNSKETIELLLNAGANVDARANSGATPLCFAAQEDASAAAALLLRRGADLATRCAGGPVRDDGTVQPGGPHSRFSGYTPLHYCAHYNADKAAKVLLRHPTAKAAMEIPDLSERLPIHVAVARGSSDVLRELLHAGARVDTRSSMDSTSTSSSSPTAAAAAAAAASAATVSIASSDGGPRIGRRFNSIRQQLQQQQQNAVAAALAVSAPSTPTNANRRGPPHPERRTPRSRSGSRAGGGGGGGAGAGSSNASIASSTGSTTPVSSPVLRSMIPAQPVSSSKPWNCLTQRSIDECRQLISESERSWAPGRHSLFTPADRAAVVELLKVGKRLEMQGSGLRVKELWPHVLSFCGRGWFEVDGHEMDVDDDDDDDDHDEVMEVHMMDISDITGGSCSDDDDEGHEDESRSSPYELSENHPDDDDGLSLPRF